MADRSLIGKELQTLRFSLDRSKLAELSRALFEQDPVYLDPHAATAAGFDDVPVPFIATVMADYAEGQGGVGLLDEIEIDGARSVHGEVEWRRIAPMRVGDDLVARRRIVGVDQRSGRRGGAMTLVRVETEVTNQRGELVVLRTDTYVERET